MATHFRKLRKNKSIPGTIIECKSGRFLAYYEHRSDIIANGENEREVKRNLKEMYKSIIAYEKEEEEERVKKANIDIKIEFKTKQFKEKMFV